MKSISFTLCFFLFQMSIFAQNPLDWVHTNGPEGGSLPFLASNENYAFAAGNYYTYRTSDGENWERLDIGAGYPISVHGDTVVLLSKDPITYTLNGYSLYFSGDNGETWSERSMPSGVVYSSSLEATSHGIYMSRSSDNLLYHSPDFGMTWEVQDAPDQFLHDFWGFEDRLYLASSNKLYRSDEFGQNWELLENTPPGYIRDLIAKDNYIFAVANDRFLYSSDEGQTWDVHTGPDNEFSYLSIANDKIYISGYEPPIRVSDDFGATLSFIGMENSDFGSFFYLEGFGDDLLIATYDDGVVRWNAALGEFEAVNNGFNSGSVRELVQNDEFIFAGTGTGVYQYNVSDEAWEEEPSYFHLENYTQDISTSDEGIVLAVPEYGYTALLSTDNGQTWDSLDLNNISQFVWVEFVQVIGNRIFAHTLFDGTFYSDDLGETWQETSVSLGVGRIVEFNGKHYLRQGTNLMVSEDEGITWSDLSDFTGVSFVNGLSAAGSYLFCYGYVPNSGQFDYQLFASTDGVTWSFANEGIPESISGTGPNDPWDAYFDIFFLDGKYYLNKYGVGLFVSENNLESWLPLSPIRNQELLLRDGQFYAGGFSGGVIKFDVPEAFAGLFTGRVFLDENGNNVQDGAEPPIANVKVNVNAPQAWYPYFFTTTDNMGDYAIGVYANPTDTVYPQLPIISDYIEGIEPPFYTADNFGEQKDFAVQLTEDITDVSIQGFHFGRPRPGFDSNLWLSYRNEGTIAASGKISLQLDPNLTYLSAEPMPTEVIGDSLVWDYNDLALFGSGNITISINVPATVPLETVVESHARITTINQDEAVANNYKLITEVVVGSYDPNDKKVEPAEGLTPAQIEAGEELLYTIRFQNTGTYLAEKVRITDMLDTAHYYPSLRFVAASHEVTSFQLQPTGNLEILFDQIFLPDSLSDEPGSHGFVTFAIQRNQHFNAARAVNNFASIYFDFNEPIFTNEVSFTIPEEPVSTVSTPLVTPKISIYPNPAVHSFQVETNGLLSGNGTLSLRDISGRLIYQVAVDDFSQTIVVDKQPRLSGVFVIHLTNGAQTIAEKLILQGK